MVATSDRSQEVSQVLNPEELSKTELLTDEFFKNHQLEKMNYLWKNQSLLL